jgi:filamentous hemagglutinin
MHVKPANNALSELMGTAYEKATNSMDYGTANFFGYTNAAETYAGALSSREDKATNSLGHSRGTLVQESSFTILANRPDDNGKTYTNPNLTVRGVGGAADAQSYTEAAVKITGEKARDNITYNYFSNDPVSTSRFSGGNPGVWTLKDLWQVYDTNSSMHSGYGTGCKDCTQVEIPVPGGHQGAPEGNAKLIQFKGGQQIDRAGNPVGNMK